MLEQKILETKQPQYKQDTLFAKEKLDHLKTVKQHWEEMTLRKSLERIPEREYLFTTSVGSGKDIP